MFLSFPEINIEDINTKHSDFNVRFLLIERKEMSASEEGITQEESHGDDSLVRMESATKDEEVETKTNIEALTIKDIVEDAEEVNKQETEEQTDAIEEDDEFGSFSDASFDDFEEPQQSIQQNNDDNKNDLNNDNNSNGNLPIKFPQSTFSNPELLESKLEELVDLTFPETLRDFEPPQNISILNQRSEHLLERLTSLIYLKPYNWQKSSLRKQLLVTLGLSDVDDSKNRRRLNQFDADQYIVKPFAELKIRDDEKLRLINETDYILEEFTTNLGNDDDLGMLNDHDLNKILERYSKELETVEKLLSIWENEKLRLQEDKNTFETVVENLIGHTQRIRREESFKSMQKEKEKSKGIGSIFRKKKK